MVNKLKLKKITGARVREGDTIMTSSSSSSTSMASTSINGDSTSTGCTLLLPRPLPDEAVLLEQFEFSRGILNSGENVNSCTQ